MSSCTREIFIEREDLNLLKAENKQLEEIENSRYYLSFRLARYINLFVIFRNRVSSLVPERGLEPLCSCEHTYLKRACIPISALWLCKQSTIFTTAASIGYNEQYTHQLLTHSNKTRFT